VPFLYRVIVSYRIIVSYYILLLYVIEWEKCHIYLLDKSEIYISSLECLSNLQISIFFFASKAEGSVAVRDIFTVNLEFLI